MTDVNAYFNIVYDATFRELTRYCVIKAKRVQDVDDLLQATYEQFYKHLRRRGTESVENAQAYLLTILKKQLSRYYRFHALHQEVSLDETVEPLATAETPEDELLGKLTLDEIWACVEAEPQLSQKAFVLHYGYDMKVTEVAEALGITEAAARNRLLHTRNRIRETMKKEETA
ncbi:MAG: sigma-70 family RNA polymerase sigma factor [Clostridia bacterium]|nr:sigma-70 family RNA polymerase sigma factor [Clostridia bacterium]